MAPQTIREKDFVFVKNIIKPKKYGGNFMSWKQILKVAVN